jgi:peptide/nickel transport system substrate-binding protein
MLSRRLFTAGAAASLAVSRMSLSYAQDAAPGQPMPPLLLESYADQTQLEAGRILTRALVEVGFPVTLRPVDFGQLLGKVYDRRDFNIALMGLGAPEDRIDPDFYIRSTYATTGTFNIPGYSNPDYDKLADAQLQEFDPARRRQLIIDAQRIYARDLPSWVVCSHSMINPVNKRLFKNFVPSKGIGLEAYHVAPWLLVEPIADVREFNLATLYRMSSGQLFTEASANGRGFLRFIYDTFLRYDGQQNLLPWAAESYKVVDPVTIDLKIRPGMTWHDGMPVTPADAVFTFNYLVKWKPTFWRAFLAPIKAAELQDDGTVRVHLNSPAVTFITTSLAQITILPEHIWKNVPEAAGVRDPAAWDMIANKGFVGSGPFKFASFEKDVDFHVTANKGHWTGGPKIDGLHYIQAASIEQMKGGMENQTIHAIGDGLPLPDGQELAKLPHIDLLVTPSGSIVSFWLNMRKPLFQDPAIRQAMYYAMPRKRIVDIVYGGAGQVGRRSPLPPLFDNFIPPDSPGDEYDPERARKILSDAGYTWKSGKLVMKPA